MAGDMTILVTGGSGLLGRYLYLTAPQRHDVRYTFYMHPQPYTDVYLDMADEVSVSKAFDVVRPDVVIHTAGQGSVDICERDYHQYYGINVCGSYRIMAQCEQHDAMFVGVSSNAVYHGDEAPYSEADPTQPINMYGWSKVLMEHAVRNYNLNGALVVRPILMYGWPCAVCMRGNWVTAIVDSLSRSQPMKVVDDVITQPLYARECAKAIWHLIDIGASGFYNVAGATVLTMYQFACEVAHVLGFDPRLIHPATLSDFPNLAPRPIDTHYSLDKMMSVGLTPMHVYDGLRRMKEEPVDNGHDIHTQ